MKKRSRILVLVTVILLLLIAGLLWARHAAGSGLLRPVKSYTSSLLRIDSRTLLPAAAGTGEAEPDAAGENALGPLRDKLDKALRRQRAAWDVWVEALADGEAVSCRRNLESEESLVSASLIKLFIMGAVYQRIESGALAEESVREPLQAMITVSDNDAANELTLLLGDGDSAAGMEAVTAWAASIGCRGVEHNRLMLAGNGLENYVTAEACARLLRLIYRGECVSAYASGQMLALLKGQQVNDRIPAGLPAGTASAHKTGDLLNLCVADVGIVFSPGGDYILCAICNDPPRHSAAAEEIAALSRLVYGFFNP